MKTAVLAAAIGALCLPALAQSVSTSSVSNDGNAVNAEISTPAGNVCRLHISTRDVDTVVVVPENGCKIIVLGRS